MAEDDAYKRVTNPERFAPLHQVAEQVLTELQARYDVVVEPVQPVDPNLTGGSLYARRLTPRNGGAPITITWTGFPGVFVRFGLEHTEAFPRCGCDGCGDQLEDVVEDLRAKLESVARGDFSEPPGGYDFRFPDGSESGGQVRRRIGWMPRTRQYEAWPLIP